MKIFTATQPSEPMDFPVLAGCNETTLLSKKRTKTGNFAYFLSNSGEI
jgi:hypothetical protein